MNVSTRATATLVIDELGMWPKVIFHSGVYKSGSFAANPKVGLLMSLIRYIRSTRGSKANVNNELLLNNLYMIHRKGY